MRPRDGVTFSLPTSDREIEITGPVAAQLFVSSETTAAGRTYTMTGVGPFTHAEAKDRPPSIFGGKNRLYFEPGKERYLLLPIILWGSEIPNIVTVSKEYRTPVCFNTEVNIQRGR